MKLDKNLEIFPIGVGLKILTVHVRFVYYVIFDDTHVNYQNFYNMSHGMTSLELKIRPNMVKTINYGPYFCF